MITPQEALDLITEVDKQNLNREASINLDQEREATRNYLNALRAVGTVTVTAKAVEVFTLAIVLMKRLGKDSAAYKLEEILGELVCPICGGTGENGDHQCTACNGSGIW